MRGDKRCLNCYWTSNRQSSGNLFHQLVCLCDLRVIWLHLIIISMNAKAHYKIINWHNASQFLMGSSTEPDSIIPSPNKMCFLLSFFIFCKRNTFFLPTLWCRSIKIECQIFNILPCAATSPASKTKHNLIEASIILECDASYSFCSLSAFKIQKDNTQNEGWALEQLDNHSPNYWPWVIFKIPLWLLPSIQIVCVGRTGN